MFCPSCGQETDDDHRFCAQCGVDLQALKAAEERKDEPSEGGSRLKRLIGRSRRELLVTGATALAIVLAVAAFFVLDAAEDAPEAPQNPYTVAIDRQCLEAKGDIAERVGRNLSGQGSVAGYASDISERVSVWRTDLQSFTPPPEQERSSQALNAALLEVNGAFAQLAEVARGGNGAAIAEQAAAVDEATLALEDAIVAADLRECAALDFNIGQGATG